jgi:hypothetical protein
MSFILIDLELVSSFLHSHLSVLDRQFDNDKGFSIILPVDLYNRVGSRLLELVIETISGPTFNSCESKQNDK